MDCDLRCRIGPSASQGFDRTIASSIGVSVARDLLYNLTMRKLVQSRPSLSTLACLSALCLAACVGSIDDEGSSRGSGPGPKGPQVSPTGRDPGRVTLHRLNRAEYDNTVRDLLGTALTPAKDFPADDHGYGYDNIADVLTISPTQVVLYERAAEALIEDAMKPPQATSATQLVEAETLTGSTGSATSDAYNLWSNGDITATFALPSDGTYEVRVRAWSTAAGTEDAKMNVLIGSTDLGTFDVPNDSSNPLIVTKQADVTGGSKVVTVSFINDFYEPPSDRNLYVDYIEVEGPIGATTGKNALRDRILICDPSTGDACQRQILEAFTKRAWRRPVTAAEIDKLMAFIALAKAEGEDEEVGIKLALRAVLISHNFVFRVELDETPNGGTVRPLNAWELASRLSYFLWSSMPDDALFAKAESGELLHPEVLAAEARRMLQDPKSSALVDNFAGQWLYTRALVEHEPDYNFFPEYEDGLRVAMEQETRLFFKEFLEKTPPDPRPPESQLRLRGFEARAALRDLRRERFISRTHDHDRPTAGRLARTGQYLDHHQLPDAHLPSEAGALGPGAIALRQAPGPTTRCRKQSSVDASCRNHPEGSSGQASGRPDLRKLPRSHGPRRHRP